MSPRCFSGLAEYFEQIFPVSMVVGSVSAAFLAVLLAMRKRIGAQVKLSLMILTGLVISLTAIQQNPYAPDGYMVMGAVVAIAFANWPLKRAVVIPVLVVLALTLTTVAIKLNVISVAPFQAHTENSPGAWLAANVSPPLFLSREFVVDLKELLRSSGVDPSRLIIEITEEVFAIDVDKIRKACRDLQELGIQISLDDFGSGVSSLSFLRSMNFDELKIDRGFIQSLDHDEKSFLLLSSMCKLGQDLQCRVVVEGVETADQLALVEQTLCAQIQGFLFARPLPIQAILPHYQSAVANS